MNGIQHFESFLLTGILLNITPGNDTVFILSKSIGQGRKAGIVAALGIGTGCILHTLLAALGLSLIIAKSLLLFNIIKYAGAGYLLFIGFRMFTDQSSITGQQPLNVNKVHYHIIYRDAILTNVLNPKVALFFIAFLPQFIDPALKNTILPFLLLGLTFITTGTIWCLLLAVFAAFLSKGLRANRSISKYISKICGLSLIALGIKVIITERN